MKPPPSEDQPAGGGPVAAPPGGAWLFGEAGDTSTPEDLPPDAGTMSRSIANYMRSHVLPARERMEAHDVALQHELLRGSGLTGPTLPDAFGGLSLSKTLAARLTEQTALDLSFAISLSVHSGVGTLPLLYFGSDVLRQTYLPLLASGDAAGAFALSEAGSGSDALAAQTRAVPTPGGDYRISGSKMWITNAAFAGLFTVFARASEGGFSAFLVERDAPGLSVGPEERKMGLHGSSTCPLTLEDVEVPAGHVIGEIGAGHRPALYALNMGRFNIAAIALGACKELLRLAAEYAAQRQQFGRRINQFGLIRGKLARMAAQTYLLECMLYRSAGWMDVRTDALGDFGKSAAEEYAIEAALLKTFGTETFAYVADEALQIHGGYGFSSEYPVARFYRDARVFRIFEGTNEINRLSVEDQLVRRVERGRLALPDPPDAADPDSPLSISRSLIHILLQDALAHVPRMGNQERAAALADTAIMQFALQCGRLRAARLYDAGRTRQAELADKVARTYAPEVVATLMRVLPLAEACTSGTIARPNLPAWSETRDAIDALADAVAAGAGYPW